MNTRSSSIAIYSGVFILSYCIFLYQANSSENKNIKNNSATVSDLYVSSPPVSNNDKPIEKAEIVAQPDIQENKSTKTREHTRTVHDRTKELVSSDNFTEDKTGTVTPLVELDNNTTPVASFTNSYTQRNNNVISQRSSNPAIATTVSSTSTSSSSSTTTIDSISITTTSSNEPDVPAETEIDTLAETEQEPWPTSNCPAKLPDGSTKDDAQQMRSSYGCVYLEYCQTLNNGDNDYICWWGFRSAT